MMILTKKVYIYSLSDDNDYVRYIGKSIDPKERLLEHIQESKKGKPTLKNNWLKSIVKKNIKPKLDIIDIVDEEDWEFWEQHYISLYKSWGFHLKNSTKGGNGTGSGALNPNYGKKLTEEHKKKCSIALKGEKNPFYGKKHTEETLKKIYKPVLQYDLNGDFINEWKSIKDAEKKLNLKSISLCCNNKLLSVGGYIWKFKLDNNISKKIIINKTYKKVVYQYTLDRIFIKKWNSINDAQKCLNINHISKVCNNYKSFKSSGGFFWSYEYIQNSKINDKIYDE